MRRRGFLKQVAAGSACAALGAGGVDAMAQRRKPNVVFVFADQWRGQAVGYAGDPNVKTPHLDALAAQSATFTNAVSCCPVCSPYRASLLTGQYPLTHGVFVNDVYLNNDAVSVADCFNDAGYDTAYIGKWHLDGQGRSSFIPRERRQGFEFWKVLECTHDYNNSPYYGDAAQKDTWDGYDAVAQTREAQRYISEETSDKPFALFLSWGPPHNPYQTAPEKYKERYSAGGIRLRDNVPEDRAEKSRRELAGYYAHCSALDDCIGDLLVTLRERELEDDTVFVFTSDHGDMIGSQNQSRKQRPWDESIMVPLLVRYPATLGKDGRVVDEPINAPDLMPTLLGLCGIDIPPSVEGRDYSGIIAGTEELDDDAMLIACYAPFGEWIRKNGGKEYRGVRTRRYTYVRDLQGPWLLYDNREDPCQQRNLCNDPQHAALQARLDQALQRRLDETHDAFQSGDVYIDQWNYPTDENGTVPYKN